MKIYTKKGDQGETFLANGSKVKKYDLRVDLYGKCDELNSYIGVVNAIIKEKFQLNGKLYQLLEDLTTIQNLLFEIGAELAGYYKENRSILEQDDIVFLEKRIDQMEEELPKLRVFVLPGGSMIASFLHICRTQCRNLERQLVYAILEKHLPINEMMIAYFNRLSDYFFVTARYSNYLLGINEIEWRSERKKKSL